MPNPQQSQPITAFLGSTTNQVQNTGTTTTDSVLEFSTNSPQNIDVMLNVTSGDTSTCYNGANLGEFTRSYRFDYDFATDGGAVSTITLRGGTVPVGFVVTALEYWVQTAFTTAGTPTVAFAVGGVTISSATSTATDASAGNHVLTPTAARVTTAGKLTMAIGTTANLAGAATFRVKGYFGIVDTSSAAGT